MCVCCKASRKSIFITLQLRKQGYAPSFTNSVTSRDRRLLNQALWSIKNRKIECSLGVAWHLMSCYAKLVMDLPLSIVRNSISSTVLSSVTINFVTLAQKRTWRNTPYKDFIQQTSKNRVSKSCNFRGATKSQWPLYSDSHRLFWCTCKFHPEWLKRPLLLSVLGSNKRSGRSPMRKVVDKVDRVVGELLMGCSAVI